MRTQRCRQANRRLAISIVLTLAAMAIFATGASAATTFVPNRFDDPIAGGTNCTPPAPANGCSLRGAVAAAQTGDSVKLAAGTYTLTLGALDLPKQITILGAGPSATTIHQTALDRVIRAENQVGQTIIGVTVSGGHLVGKSGANGIGVGQDGEAGEGVDGAGIAGSGPLTLTDVVVTGNSAFGGDGGDGAPGSSGKGGNGGSGGSTDGVGISGGNPVVLTRVAVTDNLGQPGDGGAGGAGGNSGAGGAGGKAGNSIGAGLAFGSESLTATDVLISGNIGNTGVAGNGGLGGSLVGAGGAGGAGEDSVGGGIFSNGAVKLTNVTITANIAAGGTGGAGGTAQSPLTPSSGGVGGYSFDGAGGGIALYNGAAAQLASVTLAGNTVTKGTAGVGGSGSDGGTKGANGEDFIDGGGNVFLSTATLTMHDTLIAAGNGPAGRDDCTFRSGGALTSAGHNLEDANQCIAAPAAGDLVDTPAGLGPPADNGGPTETMALLSGSAAIDSGEAGCIDAAGESMETDQRGLPRGNPCDIGAFEVQPTPPAPPSSPGPVPAAGGPKLTKLKLSRTKLHSGAKTSLRFDLSAGAEVDFTLQRLKPGHRAGRKCAGAPAAIMAPAGTTKRAWKTGRLAPGRYRLTAAPVGGQGRSVTLKILG